MTERIVMTVAPDGTVHARTEGITGDRCLNYITVLEDLLEAQTVQSAYTADYHRAEVREVAEVHDVDRA